MCDSCKIEPMEYEEIFSVPLDYKLKPNSGLYDANISEEQSKLEEYEQIIKLSIAQSEKKFLTIGEALSKIKNERLYRSSRYPTFDLYIQNTFEFTRQCAYRIIKVYEFCNSGVTFDKYTYSQLVEISSIPEEDSILIAQITPEMSKRQIQRLKHEYYTAKQCKEQILEHTSDEVTIEVPKVKKTNENITYEDVFNEAEKQVELNEIQPLVLKNKEERLNFLKTYLEWEMIGKIDYLRLSIYRRRLKNKTAIIALRADREDSKIKDYPSVRYTVFFEPQSNEPNDYRFNSSYFNLYFNSENEIVDYLTKHKKEIEWGKHGVAYFLHNNLFCF